MTILDVQRVLSATGNINKDQMTEKARAKNVEFVVVRMTS
jgi:hypothetical protein